MSWSWWRIRPRIVILSQHLSHPGEMTPRHHRKRHYQLQRGGGGCCDILSNSMTRVVTTKRTQTVRQLTWSAARTLCAPEPRAGAGCASSPPRSPPGPWCSLPWTHRSDLRVKAGREEISIQHGWCFLLQKDALLLGVSVTQFSSLSRANCGTKVVWCKMLVVNIFFCFSVTHLSTSSVFSHFFLQSSHSVGVLPNAFLTSPPRDASSRVSQQHDIWREAA